MDERLRQLLAQRSDRLEGTDKIMEAFVLLFDITTWRGAKLYMRRHGIVRHHNPSGRPYIMWDEIVRHFRAERR